MLKHTLSYLRRKILEAEPEVCMDLAIWAKAKGIPVLPLAEPLLPSFELLFQNFPLGQDILASHRERLSRPQVLVAVERAVVRDRSGIIELPDGKILYEGNWWLPALKEDPAYKRRFRPGKRKISGHVYSLLARWVGSNFYHWFHDALPRLEACLSHLPTDCQFLVMQNPPQWQIESLAAFGISKDRMVEQADDCDLQTDVLWIATQAGQTSLGSIDLIRKVAARLKTHYSIPNFSPTRKFYLSRRKSRKGRRLLNEEAVMNVLSEMGFEELISEEFNLKQQIEHFSMANAVVAAHGAGLTNMIYSPPGAVIGEIMFDDTTARAHHIVLAMQLGFKRTLIRAKRVNELPGDEFDLIVDLPDLDRLKSLMVP